jgi:hypothetical protein
MRRDPDRDKRDWIADFEAAARRSLPVHVNNSFLHTYKPILDDAPFRAFGSLEEYRRWCEENVPSWLGYGRTL